MVIINMNPPDDSSYELLKRIKESSPQTAVIIMFIGLDEYVKQQYKKPGPIIFLISTMNLKRYRW